MGAFISDVAKVVVPVVLSSLQAQPGLGAMSTTGGQTGGQQPPGTQIEWAHLDGKI